MKWLSNEARDSLKKQIDGYEEIIDNETIPETVRQYMLGNIAGINTCIAIINKHDKESSDGE